MLTDLDASSVTAFKRLLDRVDLVKYLLYMIVFCDMYYGHVVF